MQKIILATFLALAVGVAFAWDTDCTLRTGQQGASCQSSKTCAEGLSCVNGLCSLITLGSACQSDVDCGGDFARCIGGACDAWRIPGDACAQNLQCTSGSCSNGICVGKTQGQNCTGGDCAKGLWCDAAQGVCRQRLDNNADCGNSYGLMISSNQYKHDLSLMCDGANICVAQMSDGMWTGSCKGIFSVDSGSMCSMDLGKWECGLGYTCTGSSGMMTCQVSQGNALCSDITACSGLADYCLCQSTVNGTIPTSNNGNSNNGNNGVTVNGNGANAGGNNGVTVNGNGANAGGNNGVTANGNGVNAGGNNGVSAGDNGVNAGGNNGVTINGNGVNAGGNNGVTVNGNGVSIGKSTQQFGDTYGVCLVDQCQTSYAKDYYTCLLEKDCGLYTTPALISNTCASQCLNQYRDLKCCQAGLNIGDANISAQNNNGRLIVVNTQGLNCQNNPPAQIVSESGAAQLVGSVLGGIAMLALVF